MPVYITTPTTILSVTDVNDHTGSPTTTGATGATYVTDDNDGTYLYQDIGNGADSFMLFDTSSDAVDPASVDTMDLICRVNILGGWSDDTLEFKCRIFESDGTTALTDELTIATAAAGADQIPENTWTEISKSFTLVANDIANWTGAQLQFYWVYSKSKGSDNAYIACANIGLTGDYTSTITLSTTDLTAPATISSGGVDTVHEVATTGLTGPCGNLTDDAIAQTHILGASHLLGSGTVQGAAATKTHEITCTGLVAGGTITDGGVIHTHALDTTELSAPATVTDAAVVSGHEVTTTNLQGTGTLTPASLPYFEQLTITGVPFDYNGLPLFTTDLTAPATISDGAVTHTHDLSTTDLTAPATIEDVSTGTVHALDTSGLTAAASISSVGLIFHHTSTTDLTSAATITDGAVDTEHHVSTTDLRGDTSIEDCLVGAQLTTTGLASDQTITGPRIGQEHDTAAGDLRGDTSVAGGQAGVLHPLATTSLTAPSTVTDGAADVTHAVSTTALQIRTVIDPAVLEGTIELETLGIVAPVGTIQGPDIGPHLRTTDLVGTATVQEQRVYETQPLSTTAGIANTGTVSEGGIILTHAPAASDITDAIGHLTSDQITQNHVGNVSSMVRGDTNTISSVELIYHHTSTTDLFNTGTLTSGSILQNFQLDGFDLISTGDLTEAEITQTHALGGKTILSDFRVTGSKIITVEITATTPIVGYTWLTDAAILQDHQLGAGDMLSGGTVESGYMAIRLLISDMKWQSAIEGGAVDSWPDPLRYSIAMILGA